MKSEISNLIESLSGSEKRHFKKYKASFKKDSEYITLYNTIENQREIRKVEGETAYSNNELAQKYRYLKGQLMESLRQYYSHGSDQMQIMNLMADAEIFYKKKLFRSSLKSLDKAKKLAQSTERFGLHLEIIGWKRRINASTLDYIDISETLLTEEEILIQAKNENALWARKVHSAVFEFKKFHGFLGDNNAEHLNRILPLDSIVNPKQMKSERARFYYLWTLAMYFSIRGDHQKSYKYSKQIVKDYSLVVDAEDLIYGMLEHLTACIYTNRYAEVLKQIEIMNDLVMQKQFIGLKSIQERMFYYSNNYSIVAYASIGDRKRLMKKLESVELEVADKTGKIADLMLDVVKSSMAESYFLLSNYDKSRKIYFELTNKARNKIRKDVLLTSRLMYLFNLYLLERDELFETELKSCERFFSLKENRYDFASFIVASLKKYIGEVKIKGRRSMAHAIIQYFSSLDIEKELDFEHILFKHWAFSVLNGTNPIEEAKKWYESLRY